MNKDHFILILKYEPKRVNFILNVRVHLMAEGGVGGCAGWAGGVGGGERVLPPARAQCHSNRGQHRAPRASPRLQDGTGGWGEFHPAPRAPHHRIRGVRGGGHPVQCHRVAGAGEGPRNLLEGADPVQHPRGGGQLTQGEEGGEGVAGDGRRAWEGGGDADGEEPRHQLSLLLVCSVGEGDAEGCGGGHEDGRRRTTGASDTIKENHSPTVDGEGEEPRARPREGREERSGECGGDRAHGEKGGDRRAPAVEGSEEGERESVLHPRPCQHSGQVLPDPRRHGCRCGHHCDGQRVERRRGRRCDPWGVGGQDLP